MLQHRLNIKDIMKKKNFYVQFTDYALCDTYPKEDIIHLFYQCNFSQGFLWALGIEWNTDLNIYYDMIMDDNNRNSEIVRKRPTFAKEKNNSLRTRQVARCGIRKSLESGLLTRHVSQGEARWG
jgi:hypothetical protein